MLSQWIGQKKLWSQVVIAALMVQPLCSVNADEQKSVSEVKPVVRDVKLDQKGGLTIQVMDVSGKPVANSPVSIAFNGKTVAKASSNKRGEVQLTGLRPGIHAVQMPNDTAVFRFWDARTAPPGALKRPAVTVDASTVRGQFGGPALGPLIGTGVTIAALVVAIDAKNEAGDAQDDTKRAQAEINALEQRVEDLEAASP